jgi:hypothetical protein
MIFLILREDFFSPFRPTYTFVRIINEGWVGGFCRTPDYFEGIALKKNK